MESKQRMLYNVTFNESDTSTVLHPRVPISAADDEDLVTPRVCFADSIEGCISAIGSCNRDLHVGCRIVVRSVHIEDLIEGNIITPDDLFEQGKVPDAMETGEYWYLDTVVVSRDVYEVVDFSYEYALAFTCIPIQDVIDIALKHGVPRDALIEFNSEAVYGSALEYLGRNKQYGELDKFDDEVAALPWAQRIKITKFSLKEV